MRNLFYFKILQYLFFVLSLILSIYFLVSPDLPKIIKGLGGFGYIGVFFAGFFFTSVITTSTATVTLFLFGKSLDPFVIAPIAAFGAMLGDFILFSIIKYRFSNHYRVFDRIKVKLSKEAPASFFKRYRMFKKFIPLVGALIIASPLPDELGIALLGISKYETKKFFILSFVMNLLGILGIAYLGRIL